MIHPMKRSEKTAAPSASAKGQNFRSSASSDLLQEVLESLPQGVIMFTAEGIEQFTNRRCDEMCVLTPDCVRPGVTL